LRGNILDPIIIFIASILLAMVIVTGLAAVCYICCSRRNLHQDQVDFTKENSKSYLLNEDRKHADPEFYENLPFNKLRNPPKLVLDHDDLDFADCDYLDIYANGPIKYKETSQRNANERKKTLEMRKEVKSSYL